MHIGIVDLMATTARGLAQNQFARLVESSLPRGAEHVEISTVDLDPQADWLGSPGSPRDWDLITSFDAVIVTGAEPQTAELKVDPSFALVGRILDATASRAVSVLFSCLSAHAALGHIYGLSRRRLGEKCVGVLPHTVAPSSGEITAGLPQHVTMPHSRWNTVRRTELAEAGVRLALLAGTGDWAIATSPDGFRYTFVQGHPEYFSDTLWREYRRDVKRFLYGESDDYPSLPSNYFAAAHVEAFDAFCRYAQNNRRAGTFAAFPEAPPALEDARAWAYAARVLTANWTRNVLETLNA
ncbi:MAG: homoserine O-acetyltransferase/O-succinyltransferase family protein [Frankia sp.]